MVLRLLYLALISLVAVQLRSAAETCAPFNELLDFAVENDPGVSVALATIDEAEGDLVVAQSLSRPQLSTFARTASGDEGLVSTDFNNQIGLRASQRLFDFGDAKFARQAAQSDRASKASLLMDAKNRTALDVALAYIDWLEGGAELEATKERAGYFDAELEALTAVLEEGGTTRAAVAEVAAEKASARTTEFRFRSKQDQAAAIIEVSTRRASLPCDVSPSEVEAIVFGDAPLMLSDGETLLVEAISNNPGIVALKREADRFVFEARRADRARLPIVEAVGIASVTANSDFRDSQYRDRIGLDVSVPILSGASIDGRRQKASASAARARAEAQTAIRRLEQEVRTRFRRSLMLDAQLEQQSEVLRFREDEFEAVETEYEEGLRTLPQLVDARLELEEAILAKIRLEFDVIREKLTLASLSGQLIEQASPS